MLNIAKHDSYNGKLKSETSTLLPINLNQQYLDLEFV